MTVQQFESRWGRYLFPAISRGLLTGSKLGSKAREFSVENPTFEQADIELRNLCAESGPGERGVDADNVSARAVGDDFQQIPARTVDLRKRDKSAAQVVAAPAPQAEHIEVRVKLLGRFPSERRIPPSP
jgi:hypothetical protein